MPFVPNHCVFVIRRWMSEDGTLGPLDTIKLSLRMYDLSGHIKICVAVAKGWVFSSPEHGRV
jgi:hypothetical protein